MISVFLADDHQMFRQGLRTLLASSADIEVVGEACDGQESLQEIERLKPDVAVLDIAMPGLTGIEVAKRLGKISPDTRTLILTMHADCFFAVEALKANARGSRKDVHLPHPGNTGVKGIRQPGQAVGGQFR